MARPGEDPGRRHTGLGRARQVVRQRAGQQFAQQQQQPPAGGMAAPGADPYSYESDPVLQRTRALGERTIAEAEADALRQRRQLALDYGDEQAARELGLSEADIAAAKANPFSARAKQAKAAHDQPVALDENLNKGNLFYSSARGTQQQNLSMALLEDQAGAARSFNEGAGGIAQGLLGTRRGVEEGNWAAEQDAAGRRQQQIGDLPYGGNARRRTHPLGGNIGNAIARRVRQRRPRVPVPPGGGHPPEMP